MDISPQKISVITPSFNQGKYIEQTIKSVLSQNYPNFEHIIIDGGSTDGTIEILKKYPHLQWISEKDRGQSEALNKGLRKTQGEIIAWINSDDYYPNETFHHVVKAFKLKPDAKIILGDCLFIYEGSKKTLKVVNRDLEFEDIIRYWHEWIPPTQPSVFFKSELLKEFGDFDETLQFAMEYDFWLRISRKYKFWHVPIILSIYRFHSKSKSGIGQDWSPFYEEWHTIYKRYKQYSSTLPKSTLVSVIVPFSRNLLEQNPFHLDAVLKTIDTIEQQRLRDMEILVITDITDVENNFRMASTPIPINLVYVSHLNPLSFIQSIKKYATGFAIHCSSLKFPLPDRWYCDNLNCLLDNPTQSIEDEGMGIIFRYEELKANTIKEGSELNHARELDDSIKLVCKYKKYKAILEELNKNNITFGTFDKVSYYFTRYIIRNITRPFRRLLRRFNTRKTKV